MKKLEPNNVIVKSRKRNEFALKVFTYFYSLDKLKSIEPYIVKSDHKYKVMVTEANANLKGLLFKGTLAEVQADNNRKVRNKQTNIERTVARWYSDPFVINGETYYLSNQWSLEEGDTSKSNPTIAELKKVVEKCYPNCRVESTMELEFLLTSKQDMISKDFNVKDLIHSVAETGLIYSLNLVDRFVCSLLSKPFVILSGLAGSGKTQLALAIANTLSKYREDTDENHSQIRFVSVGADWTNREPLLGYPNALKADSYVMPDSKVLQTLLDAEKNPTKPYFIILDEMNLSYVERYFADFLSAMEASNTPINLCDSKRGDVPSSVKLTKNVFIIGTINVDETTYMFSPKVLDRANVIEFKVSEDEMSKFLTEAPHVDITKCYGQAADMAEDFVKKAIEPKVISQDANDVLNKFFKQLKTVNAEFGYRTATEIGRFISLATAEGCMKTEDAIDAAIVQKLLPKLHGSRKKIVPVLKELWKLCGCRDIEELENPSEEKAIYKLSADKILRMYNSAIDNGFTSFAEA